MSGFPFINNRDPMLELNRGHDVIKQDLDSVAKYVLGV